MVMTYRLEGPERVSLRIFNAAGALIATRVEGVLQPAGEHRVAWDGTGEDGRRAPRGVYFVRLDAGAQTAMRRVALLR
jgi:flagellar hook assembly protein FlgD